jgi:hypothetical protein
MLIRGFACLSCLACVACGGPHQVRLEFSSQGHDFTFLERWTIQRIADDAAIQVRVHLPALPKDLLLMVRHGTDVNPDIGATADAMIDSVMWTVDTTRPEGVRAIANAQLHSTLFHDLHHVVRGATQPLGTLMDFVIAEGLATAFERDFAGQHRPWADYPPDVAAWVAELQALPAGVNREPWLFRHPDGRRWIGYKAGTYIVDQAIAHSGQTSAQLVAVPTNEVLSLSRLAVGGADSQIDLPPPGRARPPRPQMAESRAQ